MNRYNIVKLSQYFNVSIFSLTLQQQFTAHVEGQEERPVCVFCLKTLAAEKMKTNKFKRHLEIPHPSVGHLSSFKDKH